MLEPLFLELGFSKNEIRLFLLLAESGKSTAQQLAKRAKIPRTTAYSVLEGLIHRGVISQEQKQGTTFYIANKPSSLQRIVEQEQEQVRKRAVIVKELIEQVAPLFKSKFFSIPKIQFFEGRSSVESLLYDNLESWRAAMAAEDSIWWGFQDHTFVEEYLEWLKMYWKLKTSNEKVYLISNQAKLEDELRGKVPGRIIKPIGETTDFSSTLWVMGDYIALIMTRNEPHYAFQIRDAVFAANLRELFKLLWSKL